MTTASLIQYSSDAIPEESSHKTVLISWDISFPFLVPGSILFHHELAHYCLQHLLNAKLPPLRPLPADSLCDRSVP